MKSTKFFAILLMSMILTGTFTLALVVSSLSNNVVITSTGRITDRLYARSGSASDIQEAVNWVAAHGGVGNVYIPAGTFNFVEVGQPWETVNIPAGVNLFGAPTERDANGQVIEWKTVLVMPYDVPGSVTGNIPQWFRIYGNGDPAMPSRFSDIKLQGFRSIDPSSVTVHYAIEVNNVADFRIDHCCFEHTTCGIAIWGLSCHGVIDHCRIYNLYGYDNLANYLESNVCYGIEDHRGFSGVTFDPTMEVLGKYTDYTIFIEDCYFSKWRHCISGAHGAHYVFRYNTIDQDWGHNSLDTHGRRDKWAGTRAAEFYENILTNAVAGDIDQILHAEGGAGVWFNNYIDTSYRSSGIYMNPTEYTAGDVWRTEDFYLWSTKGPWTSSWSGIPSGFTADRNVLADWSRPAYNSTDPRYPNVDPTWSIAGYKPYPYPHPLTLEATP